MSGDLGDRGGTKAFNLLTATSPCLPLSRILGVAELIYERLNLP
ncbi:hypothetical protein AB3R30_05675 [Leptolyngbyaceae cyanobacterium UHCC 1019]